MKNNLKLFLDDIRMPEDAWIYSERIKMLEKSNTISCEWDIVRNYEDFCEFINKFGIPSVVSFDHDLSEDFMKHYFDHTVHTGIIEYDKLKTKCGLHCAEYLFNYCVRENIKFPEYFIHSANRWGSSNIKKCIEDFIKKYPHLQS